MSIKFFFCFIILTGTMLFSSCDKEEQVKTHEYIFLSVDTSGITENSVILKWTKSTAVDFDHYQLHKSKVRGFVPSSSTFIKDIANQNQTKDTVFPLLSGTTYYFKLRMFTKDANATESNEATARTLSP